MAGQWRARGLRGDAGSDRGVPRSPTVVGYTLWLSAKAMGPMLVYLRGLGVVPSPAPKIPATEAEKLQEDYRAYLVQERGLAVGTIVGYLVAVRSPSVDVFYRAWGWSETTGATMSTRHSPQENSARAVPDGPPP